MLLKLLKRSVAKTGVKTVAAQYLMLHRRLVREILSHIRIAASCREASPASQEQQQPARGRHARRLGNTGGEDSARAVGEGSLEYNLIRHVQREEGPDAQGLDRSKIARCYLQHISAAEEQAHHVIIGGVLPQ